jgi:hypothetical protein
LPSCARGEEAVEDEESSDDLRKERETGKRGESSEEERTDRGGKGGTDGLLSG